MEAVKKYNLGDIAEGTVNSMNNYGIFVTLEKDLSGLVHTSELPEGVKDPKEIAKVGEPIRVKIISLDPKEHRLGFSLRMDRKVEKPDRSQDSGDRSQEEK
jgi:ribosomal protein S1